MKKMMLVFAVLCISIATIAQPKIRGNAGGIGTIRQSQPARVIVVQPGFRSNGLGMGLGYGYGFGLNPYRFSPFGYSPFDNPYQNRNYNSMPTALELDIEEIRNDYNQKMDGVKADELLSRKERRQQIKALKHEREDEIIDAKRRYIRTR
jgi:hypothetical protein